MTRKSRVLLYTRKLHDLTVQLYRKELAAVTLIEVSKVGIVWSTGICILKKIARFHIRGLLLKSNIQKLGFLKTQNRFRCTIALKQE